MATYKITAKYEYEAEIEAGSEAEAESLFLKDLNDYYVGTYDYDCEELASCRNCGNTDEYETPDPDFLCEDCAELEKEEEEESN